jgi:polysaccharide chain length determinant protein (PEP-CTERM system associated)
MADAATTDLLEELVRAVKGSWRYRLHALATAWALCLIGWAVVLSMPDVYEARARVFVDTSSRLREVLGTIAFQPDIESRVNIVRQAMLGRPQLEKVAAESGLASEVDSKEDRDRLIAGLTETIGISAGRSGADRNLFRITYAHEQREMAIKVVDSLLNAFVEDVLQQKARGADAAQQFLREQIEHYSEQLAAADQRLADFKRENVGLLPGDGGDYFGRMQLELAALEQLRSDLRVAESKRNELQRQLSGETPDLPEGAVGVNVPGSLDVDVRIAALVRSLDELLLRYTEQHPEVIGLREQIAQLRQQRAEEMRALAGAEGVTLATNPVYQSVQIAFNDAKVEVATLQAKIADSERKAAELRELLDTMPEVEAELARLTRDYANTKALYDQLVAQLERERLVNDGDDREVVNFQVIDPPMASVDPVAPRRTLLLLGVIVFGFAAGGGLAYLLNMLNPVFDDAKQLRVLAGLPVAGVVSLALGPREMLARRFRMLCYGGMVAGLLVTGGAVVIFRGAGTELLQRLLS